VRAWTAPPLLDRRYQKEQAEAEQQHIRPDGSLAGATRIRDPGNQEHDRAGRGEARAPGKDERQALRPSSIRPDHEHDGDDRHWEDRNRDRQRQHVSERLSHTVPTLSSTR
jgi:hypothetical protein